MKIYVDQKTKFEDMKSTAWSFTSIGLIGIVLLVLLDLGILPIQMDTYMKTIMTIVMSILFAFFIYTGVRSFFTLKSLKSKITQEKDISNEIINWFLSEKKDLILNMTCEEDSESEQFYFPRYEKMSQLIQDKYPDLSEEFLDHIVEELYAKIFP